jgi:hypothetical protein
MSEGCHCEADAMVTENRGNRVGSKNAAKVASSLRQRKKGMRGTTFPSAPTGIEWLAVNINVILANFHI